MIQPQYFQQQYPQSPSAVSINIYEPKSYGSAPNNCAPYGYTNQLYSMPQASAWAQQPQNFAVSPYQQYAMNPTLPTMPQQIMSAPIYDNQQKIIPMPNIQETAPVVQQEMPQSAIETQPQQANQVEQTQQPQMPEVTPQENVPQLNVDALVQDLKSPDYVTQKNAITSIANIVNTSPDLVLQAAVDPVKQGLIDIINKDSSTLPQPSEEELQLIAKKDNGQQLTPEEEAKLGKGAEKFYIDKNKMIALFTLSMLQKAARDNVAQYAQFQQEQGKQAPAQPGIKELMGYNDIANVIKNDPNPEVRSAGVQALQYMAKPEEKADVEQALQPALNGQDQMVKSVAENALNNLSVAPAESAQQPTAAQQEQTAQAEQPQQEQTAQTEQQAPEAQAAEQPKEEKTQEAKAA